MPQRLSKSKFMSGRQCEKRLWLEVHRQDLITHSEEVKRLFSVGHTVNDAAHSLYADGRLIPFDHGPFAALSQTGMELANAPERTLFEATFAHEDVLVRVDILKWEKDGYRLIEVKSATEVKDPYYADCAVQAWVLEGNGVPINRVELAHIDSSFVYGGDGDYRGLFKHHDMTDAIADLKKEIPELLAKFHETLEGDEPDIATGPHCTEPYSCPFIPYCSEPGAEYPVTCLPRGRQVAEQLENEGIHDIRDIPPSRLHSETHEWIRQVTISGKGQRKSADEVKEKLNAYPYPRYYIDFETIWPAVPIWKGTSPYQQSPFQWSCHIEVEPRSWRHAEFLDTTGESPMRPFTESLLEAVGESGPIFVYNQGFEGGRLKEMAERFPDLQSAIFKVLNRLVDLLPITRKHYYHPDMHGRWGLKEVLATIAPALDYGNLGEVQEGGDAGTAYLEMIHPKTPPARAQKLANDLRAYCERDTEAMIALVQFLSTGRPYTGMKSGEDDA